MAVAGLRTSLFSIAWLVLVNLHFMDVRDLRCCKFHLSVIMIFHNSWRALLLQGEMIFLTKHSVIAMG